jgi:hypothetical protein
VQLSLRLLRLQIEQQERALAREAAGERGAGSDDTCAAASVSAAAAAAVAALRAAN